MFPVVQAIIAKIFHLQRKCPKCKREQVVPMSSRNRDVRCKYCSARIPRAGQQPEPEEPVDNS